MKKSYLTYIILIVVLFSGCSSKSVTRPNLKASVVSKEKLPYAVLLDGSNIKDFFLDEDLGFITTTVDYKEALLESVRHQLKNNFKEVYVMGIDENIYNYDYRFDIKNEIKADCGGRCYTSYTNLTAYDVNN
ncbi:MAG: hypothetical protein OQK11_08995, partial [Thiovulaceae bacterium]|nr:hypothetical protein [Sulfurimonadaceae bacterium]